jgi:hypothetical protein
MSATGETLPDVQVLDQLDRDTILQFSGILLPTLTDKPWGPDVVGENLQEVLASPNSHLLVLNEGGVVTSTATVNFCRTLHGEGVEAWVDDVVTDPVYQGGGRMKHIMAAAEALAVTEASHVSLTSSTHRGPARAGYEKTGYVLKNEEKDHPLVVFRNTSLGYAAIADTDLSLLGANYTNADIGDLAELLNEDFHVIERNLEAALASPTTAVIVSRNEHGISGVAVANETPIPVGKKPWIDDIAGTPEGIEEAMADANGWVATRYDFANIVAHPDADFGPDYVQRSSGLYVKQLGAPALASVIE